MQTLFLSGFSDRNKDWMNSVIASLPSQEFVPTLYPHWGKEIEFDSYLNNLNLDDYLTSVLPETNPEINILAKSYGTLLASKLISSQKVKINKVVLCGIPEKLLSSYSSIYQALATLAPTNLLIIQNEFDKYGPAKEISTKLGSLGINTQIVEIPNDSSHDYNQLELFANFLNS